MPFETTRRAGILMRKYSATAAVPSFEPSSTTRTSALRPDVERYSAIRSSVAGRRDSSLNEGTMMERSGAAELIVKKFPASHGIRRAVQIGSLPASLWGKHHHASR